VAHGHELKFEDNAVPLAGEVIQPCHEINEQLSRPTGLDWKQETNNPTIDGCLLSVL
jgi:hypothetical protein